MSFRDLEPSVMFIHKVGETHVYRFVAGRVEGVTLTDPETAEEKTVSALVLVVTEVDGQAATRELSILSKNDAMTLKPLLESRMLMQGRWEFRREKAAFGSRYSIRQVEGP